MPADHPPLIVTCHRCGVDLTWVLGDYFECLICGAKVTVRPSPHAR